MESSPGRPGDPSRKSGPRARPRTDPGEGARPRADADAGIPADERATELDLLNITEIAAALRVSKMTVYRFIRDGRLPAFRVGHSLRVHRRDLAAYLDAAHLAPPYSEPAPEPGEPAPDQ